MDPFLEAARVLEDAAKLLRAMSASGTYTTAQAQNVRKAVLGVVRERLDPCAFGHLPDRRHY